MLQKICKKFGVKYSKMIEKVVQAAIKEYLKELEAKAKAEAAKPKKGTAKEQQTETVQTEK